MHHTVNEFDQMAIAPKRTRLMSNSAAAWVEGRERMVYADSRGAQGGV